MLAEIAHGGFDVAAQYVTTGSRWFGIERVVA
jgi:hypothetical protein